MHKRPWLAGFILSTIMILASVIPIGCKGGLRGAGSSSISRNKNSIAGLNNGKNKWNDPSNYVSIPRSDKIEPNVSRALEKLFKEHPEYTIQEVGGVCGVPGAMGVSAITDVIKQFSPGQIVPLLAYPAPWVRQASVGYLNSLGDQAVPVLYNALTSGSPRLKLCILEMGSSGYSWKLKIDLSGLDKVTLLNQVLHESDDPVFWEDSQGILSVWGPEVQLVESYPVNPIEFYVRQTRSIYRSDRTSGARSLGFFRDAAAPAIPDLIAMLDVEDKMNDSSLWIPGYQTSISAAASTLGLIGPAASDAIPKLKKLANQDKSSDSYYLYNKYAAAGALYQMGYEKDRYFKVLTDAIAVQPEGEGRSEPFVQAVSAFNRIGTDAKSALPRLRELTKDMHREVRHEAGDAIHRIEGSWKPVLDIWTANLKYHEPEVREDAARWIGRLGQGYAKRENLDIQSAVEALYENIDDPEPTAAYAACQAIIDLQGADERVVKALGRIEVADSYTGAARTLERLGSMAKAAVPDLLQAMDNSNSSLVSDAIRAVQKISGSDEEIIDRLIELLRSGNKDVRKAAASGLIQLKSDISRALPFLKAYVATEQSPSKDYVIKKIAEIEKARDRKPGTK